MCACQERRTANTEGAGKFYLITIRLKVHRRCSCEWDRGTPRSREAKFCSNCDNKSRVARYLGNEHGGNFKRGYQAVPEAVWDISTCLWSESSAGQLTHGVLCQPDAPVKRLLQIAAAYCTGDQRYGLWLTKLINVPSARCSTACCKEPTYCGTFNTHTRSNLHLYHQTAPSLWSTGQERSLRSCS